MAKLTFRVCTPASKAQEAFYFFSPGAAAFSALESSEANYVTRAITLPLASLGRKGDFYYKHRIFPS